MVSKEQIISKIKDKIKCSGKYNFSSMKRPLDDDEVIASLMPFKYCQHAHNYLFKKNHLTTIDIIKEFGKILLNDTMNPHNAEYYPKEYFVFNGDSSSTLNDLSQLCSTRTDIVTIFRLAEDDGVILHLGAKGSGKTLVQNIWLFDHYNWFEENNILWIRCDAHKLFELWKKDGINHRASIEDYLYGQLVYVFAKYLKKSELFERIYQDLKNDNFNTQPYEDSWYSGSSRIYKRDADSHYASGLHYYQTEKNDSTRKLRSITDWIDKINLDIDNSTEESKKSYSVWLDMLEDSQRRQDFSNRYKNLWVLIGKWIEHFIINVSKNKYYFLKIVDGIDNTPLDNAENVEEYQLMLKNMLEVASKQEESKKIIKYISFRHDSQRNAALVLLKENYFNSDPLRKSDLNKFAHIVSQEIPKNTHKIIQKRIKYSIKETLKQYGDKSYSNDIAFLIFKYLDENEDVFEFNSLEMWSSNVRCLTFNIYHLIEFICFRYYLRGKPATFDIAQQIKQYEKINLLLNGRFFLQSYPEAGNNSGDNFYNIFSFYSTSQNRPIHLIHTRILQLITKNRCITEHELIVELRKLFNYDQMDVKECILKMKAYGIIDTRLNRKNLKNKNIPSNKKIVFHITNKANLCTKLFFNDVEYLYNCCLDCEIPSELPYAHHKISESVKSFYAPSVIKTSISFINLLMCIDNAEINKLPKENKETFRITNLIIISNLLSSFEKSLDTVFFDQDYIDDINEYLK